MKIFTRARLHFAAHLYLVTDTKPSPHPRYAEAASACSPCDAANPPTLPAMRLSTWNVNGIRSVTNIGIVRAATVIP